MYSASRESDRHTIPMWLTTNKGVLEYQGIHACSTVSGLMKLGGFALAEAMIEEQRTWAKEELLVGDAMTPLPYGVTRDALYEANLRRIAALELILKTLQASHHRAAPGFEDRT